MTDDNLSSKIGNLLIPKFVDEAATPIAKEIGQGLSDLIHIAFFPVAKLRAKRDHNLQLFLNDLNKEIASIPEESLQEPPAHIVGPALEDVAKYYHDEEYIRSMYIKLITASMDNRKVMHPSFIEIIKQLDKTDLQVLDLPLFRGVSIYCQVSIGKLSATRNSLYYYDNKGDMLNKLSVDNLLRLKLVELKYESKEMAYDEEELNNLLPKDVLNKFKKQNIDNEDILGLFDVTIMHYDISDYGILFLMACKGGNE